MKMNLTPKPHRRDFRFVRVGRTFVIYRPDGEIAAVGESKRRKR